MIISEGVLLDKCFLKALCRKPAAVFEKRLISRFADTVGGAVKFATNGEAKLVYFYDSYDKMLAKEKTFGGYDIKR